MVVIGNRIIGGAVYQKESLPVPFASRAYRNERLRGVVKPGNHRLRLRFSFVGEPQAYLRDSSANCLR